MDHLTPKCRQVKLSCVPCSNCASSGSSSAGPLRLKCVTGCDPAHLVFLLIAQAAWWFSVPQFARMLTAASASDPAEHARRRACVVRAAQRLALPPR